MFQFSTVLSWHSYQFAISKQGKPADLNVWKNRLEVAKLDRGCRLPSSSRRRSRHWNSWSCPGTASKIYLNRSRLHFKFLTIIGLPIIPKRIFKARKSVVSTSILQFQHGLSHLNQLQQPWWVYQSINQTFTSSRHPTGCSKDKRLFAYLEQQLLSLAKIEFFTCCIWAARPSRGGSLATCKIRGYRYKLLQCTVQSSIPSCPAKDREASTQRKREGKGKNLFLSSCSVSACPCLNIETCNHKNKTQIILSLNRSTGIIWTSKRKV